MTLGEYILKYRSDHDLSMRQFAALTELSPTYISFLENGRTGSRKKPSPTIDTYQKIAAATGITLDELLRVLDDTVCLNAGTDLSYDERMLIDLFRTIPESDRALVLQMIRAALGSKGLL